MATRWPNLLQELEIFFHFKGDPRVENWPLMSSPWSLITLMITYLMFCTVIGPNFMKNRKPFQLKGPIIAYNLFQAIFNVWLFSEVASCGWFSDFSYTCQPVDRSNSPRAIWIAGGVWWYFFSKLTDLVDSIFFVLRKKFDHITALHLFHHSMMPLNAWLGTKFAPGGHTTFIGLLNCFVHIVMYTYYLIAALGPQYKKYLWWKKHLTTLQLAQFVLILVHNAQLLFIDCNYPKFLVWWFILQTAVVTLFFLNFYHNEYRKPRQKPVTKEVSTNGVTSNGVCKEVDNSRRRFEVIREMCHIANSYGNLVQRKMA